MIASLCSMYLLFVVLYHKFQIMFPIFFNVMTTHDFLCEPPLIYSAPPIPAPFKSKRRDYYLLFLDFVLFLVEATICTCRPTRY